MNLLDLLLLASLATLPILWFSAGWRWSAYWSVLLNLALLVPLVMLWPQLQAGDTLNSSLSFTWLGFSLGWRIDALAWFFALISQLSLILALLYGAGRWLQRFQQNGGSSRTLLVALQANLVTMLWLLASGDLLSLFIGWELVSWAGFALMTLGSEAAKKAAYRYLLYAMSGAMALLSAIVMVYAHSQSFSFSALAPAFASFSAATQWLFLVLLVSGFGAKLALLPLHLWQAPAYSLSLAPGAVFLGAISSRMGLYAMIVVVLQHIGLAQLDALQLPWAGISARDCLAAIAVLTIILPTYTALKQNDARLLLAWHGIGQSGYMLLGLLAENPIGSAGGLLHVFNYASVQLVLLMTVFGIAWQTGTADLNRLGGLVTRMPLSFLALLVCIIGLAGLPPMNGFVSKWMVYRSLMIDGQAIWFVGSIIGTLGTILSVYKLIHNLFLGQLRLEHADLPELPVSMLLPMLATSVVVFVTGVAPGLVLEWIAAAQLAIGFDTVAYQLGGVASASGSLDMLWVVGVLFAGFAIGALLFYGGNRAKRVHPLDNYAGGHFLTAQNRYHYSDNFYAGLMHLIGPWYRYSLQKTEQSLIQFSDFAAHYLHALYRLRSPVWLLLASWFVLLLAVLE